MIRSDQELLELAAKAADLDLKQRYVSFSPCGREIWFGSESSPGWKWRPFIENADSLNLVIKLGLHIGVCIDLPVGDCSYAKTDGGKTFVELHHKSSPGAATRRAIVRAAAEIGENKS